MLRMNSTYVLSLRGQQEVFLLEIKNSFGVDTSTQQANEEFLIPLFLINSFFFF
ncbi:MAG: hypothetical protein ACI90V_001183 [Bacillariaceae sp.]|jgi:hypothetical protein